MIKQEIKHYCDEYLSAMKENRKHARTGAQLKPRKRNSKKESKC